MRPGTACHQSSCRAPGHVHTSAVPVAGLLQLSMSRMHAALRWQDDAVSTACWNVSQTLSAARNAPQLLTARLALHADRHHLAMMAWPVCAAAGQRQGHRLMGWQPDGMALVHPCAAGSSRRHTLVVGDACIADPAGAIAATASISLRVCNSSAAATANADANAFLLQWLLPSQRAAARMHAHCMHAHAALLLYTAACCRQAPCCPACSPGPLWA